MAEIVCNDGALYQTRRDTAQASGGADWVCVARGGRDGLTPTIRGTFDVLEKYARLDVDAMDGALFIAKRDSPGIFPVKIGNYSVGRASSAAAALRGESGERGEAAPTIVSWQVDRERYRAVPFLSNGSNGTPRPELNLRPLFEAYFAETSCGKSDRQPCTYAQFIGTTAT